MHAAIAIYSGLGFTRIPAFWSNPVPEALFFAKRLRAD